MNDCLIHESTINRKNSVNWFIEHSIEKSFSRNFTLFVMSTFFRMLFPMTHIHQSIDTIDDHMRRREIRGAIKWERSLKNGWENESERKAIETSVVVVVEGQAFTLVGRAHYALITMVVRSRIFSLLLSITHFVRLSFKLISHIKPQIFCLSRTREK